MKKLLILASATLILGACSSDEEKEDKAPDLSACDCKKISDEITKLATEDGLKYREIEEKIGKEKTDVCAKMFREKDFLEKTADCE